MFGVVYESSRRVDQIVLLSNWEYSSGIEPEPLETRASTLHHNDTVNQNMGGKPYFEEWGEFECIILAFKLSQTIPKQKCFKKVFEILYYYEFL